MGNLPWMVGAVRLAAGESSAWPGRGGAKGSSRSARSRMPRSPRPGHPAAGTARALSNDATCVGKVSRALPPVVELIGVAKNYPNGATALRGVDLTVQAGEFVYLIGPTGSGKSSLLRLLYREERPTRGSVIVDGLNVGRLRPRQVAMYRRRIGVIFQDFRLLPQWTVYKNVAFALRVTGASPREIRRHVAPALDEVGLLAKRDVLATQLSGGEQQRVAIARAMVHQPRLLLADEPTGNLDPSAARDVHRILLGLHARGTTVMMATHASHLVDTVRRRVIALEGGRVVRDATAGGYAHGG